MYAPVSRDTEATTATTPVRARRFRAASASGAMSPPPARLSNTRPTCAFPQKAPWPPANPSTSPSRARRHCSAVSPALRARSRWAVSWRSSPWMGTKCRGRTASSILRCCPRAAWPETWRPGSMPACTTRAPAASRRVDQHAHRPLVSGDGAGAEEHRVPPLDAQPFDLGLEQLRERRPGLALRAGGEDAHVMGQEALRLLGRAQQTLGHLETASAPGRLHVPLEAPTREDQASPRPVTDVDDVLHAVQVRGEETHQHPAAGLGDEALQRLGHDALGRCLALDLGVGRVAQQAQRLAVRQRLQSRRGRWGGRRAVSGRA